MIVQAISYLTLGILFAVVVILSLKLRQLTVRIQLKQAHGIPTGLTKALGLTIYSLIYTAIIWIAVETLKNLSLIGA